MAKVQDVNSDLLAKAVNVCETSFVIVDATVGDCPIVYANPAFERLTGYAQQDILGRNCRFLQGTDRAQPELDIVRRTIKWQMSCQVILRNYRKDGTLFLNEVSITPLHIERGRATHFVGAQCKVRHENLEQLRDVALARLDLLTDRERQVFSMLAAGHTNKMVARALGISPRTAEKHRHRILAKMEAGNITMLTRYALAAEQDIPTEGELKVPAVRYSRA